jgi:hypothetical protein
VLELSSNCTHTGTTESARGNILAEGSHHERETLVIEEILRKAARDDLIVGESVLLDETYVHTEYLNREGGLVVEVHQRRSGAL